MNRHCSLLHLCSDITTVGASFWDFISCSFFGRVVGCTAIHLRRSVTSQQISLSSLQKKEPGLHKMPQHSMEPTLSQMPPDTIWILWIHATSVQLIQWRKEGAKWLHGVGGHVYMIRFFFLGLGQSAHISAWSSAAERKHWIWRKVRSPKSSVPAT